MAAGGSADDEARGLREEARRLEREAANWERGAEGERRVAAVLDRLPADFVVFHDLTIPSSKANIDHLVIGVGGIWAIDAKFYSHKVTRGSGAGADTLWTARTPLRDTLRTTAWEATRAAALIGAPVWPMMCVIAPSIPEPAFDFNGVRVCEPSSLQAQLFGSVAGPIDVVGATEAVRREFGVEPDPRVPPPPRAVGAEAGRSAPSAPVGSQRRAASSNRPPVDWAKIFSSAPIRLAAIAAVALVAITVLPAVTGWLGQRAGEAMVESISDVSPTTLVRSATSTTVAPATSTTVTSASTSTTMPIGVATVPTVLPTSFAVPPPVRYVTTCPSAGAGWVVNWVWPGPLPPGAVGYRVRTQEPDGPFLIRPAGSWWGDPDDPPTPIRVGSTDFTIFTDLVGADGEAVASSEQPFVAPGGTC